MWIMYSVRVSKVSEVLELDWPHVNNSVRVSKVSEVLELDWPNVSYSVRVSKVSEVLELDWPAEWRGWQLEGWNSFPTITQPGPHCYFEKLHL